MPSMEGRPFSGAPFLILLYILISGATVAISTPAVAPLTFPDRSLPPPNDLQKRVPNSHPVDVCQGHYAGWNFQQSTCQDFRPGGVRAWRIYCRAPGTVSMLEGPVPWWKFGTINGDCLPSQLCVDGPYTPPDPVMLQEHLWYKRYGTAYCVEIEYLIGLGRAGLDVIRYQALLERGEQVKMTGIHPPGAGIFA
ncbi:hypothetical protein MMC32_006725 [Xylographa parallela]|nr:hypothetical protein [Xylographa parallela]